ncbi:MAG: MGMT family protein [Tenericutes bacterium]|nr:MGMT family protein [Mycoplasmatota bacterium]
MTEFTEEVIRIIKKIPYGKVMTYGQIAAAAGNPWGARQISRILSSMSRKYDLPWYRVVNSKGEISLSGEAYFEQLSRLSDEGIEVKNKKIDFDKYLYQYTEG